MFKPTYSIVKWGELYENNRTRELANLRWVPIPNSHDSDSYNELVDRKNGAALFGAWIAIVQLASRCKVRGVLTRDNGEPHDSKSIARITRLPIPTIEEALLVCNVECKWLEINAPQEGATIPQASAGFPQEGAPRVCAQKEGRNGMEGTELNGKEENGKEHRTAGADSFPIPENINTPDFREAWGTFCQHRKEIKKPFTKTSADAALKKLAALGGARAITALKHSTENGWQGIFEPTLSPTESKKAELAAVDRMAASDWGA